ncbi:MAG TPA: hypothetical protein VHO50_07075 [Bacteroidales bacterium]|nr:hypothetical protein [Bacteroidales bacterium]
METQSLQTEHKTWAKQQKGPHLIYGIYDEGMAPEYPIGAKIICQPLNINAPFFQWGEVCLIDTCNGYVLRSIHKSGRAGFIKCVSANQERWPSFEIPLRDDVIFGIYKVMFMINQLAQ